MRLEARQAEDASLSRVLWSGGACWCLRAKSVQSAEGREESDEAGVVIWDQTMISKLQSSLLDVFVNKVLLEHRCAHGCFFFPLAYDRSEWLQERSHGLQSYNVYHECRVNRRCLPTAG